MLTPSVSYLSPPSGGAGSAMESPEFAAGMRGQGLNGGGPSKRKRSTIDSSPASLLDLEHDHDHDHDLDHDERADASPDTKSRRLPGVKRACNECRQQKVSHMLLSHRAPLHPLPRCSVAPFSSGRFRVRTGSGSELRRIIPPAFQTSPFVSLPCVAIQC